jgi:hypothetical protein
MRKLYFAVFVLLALSASAAHAAGGVCLRWNKCYSEAGAAVNESFACDADAGGHLLVGSFYPPFAVNQVTRISAVVDMASASASLPAWWLFGSCRLGSLGVNTTADPSNLACEDWSAGLGSATLTSYTVNTHGPNTARIAVTATLPGTSTQDLSAFLDYFAFNVTLDNLNTVSGSACGGCATPVCIVLNSVNVLYSAAAPLTMTTPANGIDSHYVTWQGGGAPVVGAVTGCPAATPTRNASWGSVKSLYR